MFPYLKNSITNWYQESPKRAANINLLRNLFQRETKQKTSYTYFKKITKENTKIQSIKTGGYYVNMDNFINMTISRSINNVNFFNTICIDEKPFTPKKYSNKNLRVPLNFRGKGTARFLNAPNPLKNVDPQYLLAAISHDRVVLFHISSKPVDFFLFNTFIFKLSQKVNTSNQNKTFFLFDNATFHNLNEATESELLKKNIHITKTAPLGSFANPIEEFFSIVHFYFIQILSNRILYEDSYISNIE